MHCKRTRSVSEEVFIKVVVVSRLGPARRPSRQLKVVIVIPRRTAYLGALEVHATGLACERVRYVLAARKMFEAGGLHLRHVGAHQPEAGDHRRVEHVGQEVVERVRVVEHVGGQRTTAGDHRVGGERRIEHACG